MSFFVGQRTEIVRSHMSGHPRPRLDQSNGKARSKDTGELLVGDFETFLFRHNLLIDAMLKWKTLDYEEIDLLLSKKSLDALQKYRDDNEKKRKQSTGKIFLSFGSI